MPIRLIAFDLDDTLLRDDRTVAQSDLEAIREARERGIVIAPASGRRYNSMFIALEPMRHEGPAITLNGAKVLRYPAGESVYERFVEPSVCIQVAELAREMDAYLQFYMDEDFEFEKDCAESELYSELSGGGGAAVGDLADYMRAENRPSQKLLFIIKDQQKMAKVQQAMEARFGGRLSIFRSKSFYLELTHPEATKGAALRFLCGREGILPQQVMAIGDGENDLTMIEWAGVGVAVDNASDAVKARADCVTKSNMHGGVGEAIRRYALEGVLL